jgi:hypothetical protein
MKQLLNAPVVHAAAGCGGIRKSFLSNFSLPLRVAQPGKSSDKGH